MGTKLAVILPLGLIAAYSLTAGAQEPPPPADPQRYQLLADAHDLTILDRASGRLFVLRGSALEPRSVTCVDPAAGTLVSRPLVLQGGPAPAAPGEVSWPNPSDSAGEALRFSGNAGTGGFLGLGGGGPDGVMVFDAATARIYLVNMPHSVVMVDPLAPVAVARAFPARDAEGERAPRGEGGGQVPDARGDH